MAAEFGARGNGITVNSISIGPTDTDALRGALQHGGAEFEKMLKNMTLTKRIGQPQEIANVVAFIASPQSSTITGNQIPANGGALATLQS